jgi:hypothetical protein
MVDGFLYSKQYNYVIMYSSKAGCSSLRYMFLEMHKNEIPVEKLLDFEKIDIQEFFALDEEKDILCIPKLLVTRNPYLRAVSMYTNKFIGPNSLIKQRFLKKGVIYNGDSFLEFLRAIHRLKPLGAEAIHAISVHISEQCFNQRFDFSLTKDNLVKIVDLNILQHGLKEFYFKFFRDTYLYDKIKEIIASPTNCLHSNKTKRNEFVPIEDVSCVDFQDTTNIPPYQSFYLNPECKQLVDEIYEQDFIQLNYQMVLPFS